MNSREAILKQAHFIDASVWLTTFTCFKKNSCYTILQETLLFEMSLRHQFGTMNEGRRAFKAYIYNIYNV